MTSVFGTPPSRAVVDVLARQSNGNPFLALQVLHALADADVGPELHDLLGGRIDSAGRDKALALVRSTDGVPRAIACGRALADKAATHLEPLPEGPVRDALATLGHRLLDTVE